MDRDLAVALSAAPRVRVEGVFERHVSPSWAERALLGSGSGGRWAAPGAFSVIYLGRPAPSVVVEAYRHLVDDIEGMTAERVRGRRVVRAQVAVGDVLDLRSREARLSVGLPDTEVYSDVGDYAACQRIGHVAHELGSHGLLAPAATQLGETLALFVDHLTPGELPVRIGAPIAWDVLPADPRRLRVVRPATGDDFSSG